MLHRRQMVLGAIGAVCAAARGRTARAGDPSATPGVPAPAFATPVAASPGPDRALLWVQENNMGRAGGLPPDFHDLFTDRVADWDEARRATGVHLLRATALRDPANGLDDAFLRDRLIPVLRANGTVLALNGVGAMGVGCNPAKADRMAEELDQVERLRRLGAEVPWLSLQSVLSKPTDVCPGYGRNTGYERRIADIVAYVRAAAVRFPDLRVGLVDAMTAKGWDYRPVWTDLLAALRTEGLPLAFLHLDFPAEAASPGWANALAAERFARDDLGLRFGLLLTSNSAGRASDRAFHDAVVGAAAAYRAAGGRPDDLVVTSWHPHPARDLPEDDPVGWPFMKTVRDVARLGVTVPPVPPGGAATPVG